MEKIKFGIVGLNFGGWLANSFRKPPAGEHLDFLAVCDQDRPLADRIAAKHGVKAYYDMDDLLADKDIEAVGLFTNPFGRAGLIRKIIRAGKHCMATKPFELDPQAAMDVLVEAEKLGRVVHSNSPAPLLPKRLKTVLDWQQKYDLGRPIACRCDTWTAKREKPDRSWLDDPAKCPAAPITRVGVYLINDLARILGPAEKVQVMHSKIFTERPTPDNAQLGILYRSGAIANVFCSFCVGDGPGFRKCFVLNFERGTVYYNLACMSDLPPVNMAVYALDGKGQAVGEQLMVKELGEGYQWDAFHRAVRGEKLENQVSKELIVEGVKVLAAMARSEHSGRTENV